MNLFKIIFGVIIAIIVSSCEREELSAETNQDKTFLFNKEQERIWNETVLSNQQIEPQIQVGYKNNCTEVGMYEQGLVIYVGGGTGNNFSRFLKVLQRRFKISVENRNLGLNSCPLISLSRTPRLLYDSESDTYQETATLYNPGGSGGTGRAVKIEVDEAPEL